MESGLHGLQRQKNGKQRSEVGWILCSVVVVSNFPLGIQKNVGGRFVTGLGAIVATRPISPWPGVRVTRTLGFPSTTGPGASL